MGGLHKRGRIWWISYMANGHQHRESSHSTNKRAARNLLALRQAQVLEGRLQLPKSKPPFFEDWSKQFLASIRHPNTNKRYTSSIANLKGHFSGARLSQIAPDGIEAFKQARLDSGVRAATVNRDLAVLRRMLNLAKRQRLIGTNPFGEVDLLEERKERRQPHILSFEEQARLLAVAPPLLRALIVLLTETGIRVGKEGLVLKWEDVNTRNGAIYVRESKTLAGVRMVPLSRFCKVELLRWKRLMGPDFSPYVFPNPSNTSVWLKSVRKTWITALKQAKISFFPIYNLRAAFASRLSAAGLPDNLVAGMIGHSNASVLPTYAKVVDEYRRDAIRKLESYRKVAEKLITTAPTPQSIQ